MTPLKASTLLADELKHELRVHQIELELQNEELRHAYNALHESRAHYASLYELAPVGYLTLTREGLIAEINRTGASLIGVEQNKIINCRFSSLVAPKDGDRWHILFRDMMLSSEDAHNFELVIQRPDKSVFHAQLNCRLLMKADKVPIVRITLADVTERKRTELELRIAATAFEAQESIAITDSASVIVKVNKAFTGITGYTEEDVAGRKISILKSGLHDTVFYEAMWESIARVGTWQGEIWDRRKNGEIFPSWLSITAVKESNGEVTHYVATQVDITERKTAEEEILNLAFYDPLTQLPNRRLLLERLKHGIEMERREGKQLALLMLDLDRFKAVNDSFGHLAGDELLQQVAARITAGCAMTDMVARLGGDEFIVLLEDITHPQDAARVAEEIIADLSKPFKLLQSDDVRIGVSIGISLYPQHGDSLEILMDHADAALYQAKDQGRGCFAYFSANLTHVARERIALEARLRRAIEQQELRVFYQPQMDIVSGRIIGAEALVRWQDPIEGLIPPSRFIPIAEETNLIVEIGEWVLRETCNQGRQWLDMGFPPLTLAVNVSPHQFRRSDINALVATVLAETGFPAGQLELEITESGLMENQDNATNILNSLRAQGIHLAIDDFGTGYSSLAYLKHFPLDVLKIDKSFIDDIPHNKDDMEIAATIVAMGHTLGFKVLAEGVETLEQLEFLHKNGCDTYRDLSKVTRYQRKSLLFCYIITNLLRMGDRQWDIPALRKLLENILPNNQYFEGYVVEHDFPGIGHRKMLLNASRIISKAGDAQLILLTMEAAKGGNL